MSFDTTAPFDIIRFDIEGSINAPPIYDDIVVPKWFSTAICQTPGSAVYKLMQAALATAKIVSIMHQDIYDAGQIQTAAGRALDFLGEGYNISRQPDETDDMYRSRIPLDIATANSSGTKQDLQTAVAYILDMDPDDIYIDEHVVEYPQASISVRLLNNPQKIMDWSHVENLIQRVKAAGVIHISADYDVSSAWVAGSVGWGCTDAWGGPGLFDDEPLFFLPDG